MALGIVLGAAATDGKNLEAFLMRLNSSLGLILWFHGDRDCPRLRK